MEWIKNGLVNNVVEKIGWAVSHAQVPTLLLKKDRLRVYFATRPEPDITLTTFCDLDLNNLTNVIYVHKEPVLSLGEPGAFDQYGIMPSSIIEKDNIVYLYYSGWSRSVGVPYNNFTGLAQSTDGGTTFRKVFRGPILDRTKFEPFSATSPEVYYNGKWHMWYCSGTNWHNIKDKFEHTYDIKYATSTDGLNWNQNNITSIPQRNEYEAITKPTVIKLNEKFHMWYCYRGTFDFRKGEDSYRIGYADSIDLINWVRKDEQAGIHLSDNGWDSEMNAYPAVISIGKNIYMFYNGNSFGKYGFGFAQLKL
jgi:sucrose-6-phosphate hydrolase SacC (GH32 family)